MTSKEIQKDIKRLRQQMYFTEKKIDAIAKMLIDMKKNYTPPAKTEN